MSRGACVYRHGTSRSCHNVADDSRDLVMDLLNKYSSLNEPGRINYAAV